MTTPRSLPARPSLESLRKQAKTLARDAAAGDAAAVARVRAQWPDAALPLALRDAQLLIAREYGYAGWPDLTAEVYARLGRGLEWAAAQARRIIHDNDLDALRQLLARYPALLTWHDDPDRSGLVGFATGAYGDVFDPQREKDFTRAACAELLIDAGAIVTPPVYEGLLESRARGLLRLFDRRSLLPRTLTFVAALGDAEAVRRALEASPSDRASVDEAFLSACRFQHREIAAGLLERAVALDPELGARIDAGVGRDAFIAGVMEKRSMGFAQAVSLGPWKTFVMSRIDRALHEGDLPAFGRGLEDDRWLLGDAGVDFQVRLVETAALNDRGAFIAALLDLAPAILRRQPPPPAQAIEIAFTYANTHLLPLLTRIWTVPDDLPHAAGVGDLARVKRWFDAAGAPALGRLEDHYPCNERRSRGDLHWDPPAAQHVLDVALAFAVINRHFDAADFLLAHGANVNTDWNSHEPASILHHVVFLPRNHDAMRYLIDRGIDLTIEDFRWHATAAGWARYGLGDEQMAQWIEEAGRKREEQRRSRDR